LQDGLKWAREDFGADGMHPSGQGQARVATMLLDFLKTDPTAKPWFTGAWHLIAAATPAPQAGQGQPIQQMNARLLELRRKVDSGGQLTEEERQFIQQMRARNGGNGGSALPR
jgi:hypothetical protein